jgi:hypothetical protein
MHILLENCVEKYLDFIGARRVFIAAFLQIFLVWTEQRCFKTPCSPARLCGNQFIAECKYICPNVAIVQGFRKRESAVRVFLVLRGFS